MNTYNSIEEYFHLNNSLPSSGETKQLYALLWEKYLSKLDENEKKIAIANDGISYQNERIKVMEVVLPELKKNIKSVNSILDVGISERWGSYYFYVLTNCDNENNLYKFRENVPNFFKGFEVKLFQASFVKRLWWRLRKS